MSDAFVSFKIKFFIGIVAFFALVGLAHLTAVSAATTSNFQGSVEGQDTRFDIIDSAYLNISLTSSETINAYVESIPNTVTVAFNASETAASTDISISGLAPLTTYFKYQDDYSSLQELTTDENGVLAYVQDLTEQHIVFIQTVRSAKFIINDAQGGNCPDIGAWNPSTHTCTLTQDVNETIQISGSNITLDGAGHTVNGSYTGNGIYINAPGITVKNLTVQHFTSGIAVLSAVSGTRVENVTAITNTVGFNIRSAIDTVVVNNNLTNNANYGIFIGWYYAGQPSRNTQAYNNNFQRDNGYTGSDISASSSTSTGTILSLDPPIGGNYFDHYDTAAEGCMDANSDGMCDNGWNVGSGFYDNHPWTTRNGWLTPPQPDTRQLIRVGVVMTDLKDVKHNPGPITARPCKLDSFPEKTYSDGHPKEYYDAIVACLQDYYKENAYNSLNFVFTFAGNGTWQVVNDESKTEAYYKQKQNIGQAETLTTDAILASGIDESNYDIIITVHAGSSSQRESGEESEKKHLTTQMLLHQPKAIKIILAEDDPLGSWVHEIGHAIGALTTPDNTATPDLYKKENNVGGWDVMAQGSWNDGGDNPPNMSAYTKIFLGWLDEEIHEKSDYDTHWLDSLETSAIGDSVFRYNLQDDADINAQRYYLLEVRNKGASTWDSSIPAPSGQSGNLVLYYVDTHGNRRYGYADNGNGLPDVMSQTVSIPKRTPLPIFNNGGILGLNENYKDFANLVEFKASDERIIDGKLQIKPEITPINANYFISGMIGTVMFPTSTLLNEVVKRGSGLNDFIYVNPETGEKHESILNDPKQQKDPVYAINRYGHIAAYLFIAFGILAVLLWVVRRWLSKNKFTKTNKEQILKMINRIITVLAIVFALALGALIIAYEVAVAKQTHTAASGQTIGLGRSLTNPDISGTDALGVDLHAYCPGGKHIGMNYETGEFENQVDGSIVSGPNGGAPEWIYVPASVTGCKYFVSSEKNQKYLDEHPDIAEELTDKSDSYELYARYIDPQAGIFTSTMLADQVIEPGVMMEHVVSGTGADISVASGVISDPNEPTALFCPLLQQGVTYTSMAPAMECAFTNGPKTLHLKDSACNPISGARVNVRKANGAYLTYVLTNANGLADFSGYANPDASYFEVDYHGATYSTGVGTFSTGTGVQTHPYELSLKGSDCNPITGARVNLRKADGSYVTYAMTNAGGKASFEVVPNASMKLEVDYRGGTWMSESRNPDTNITLGTDKFVIRLSDSSGGVISGARVNLRKVNNTYVTYATTGDNGLASFEVLPNVPLLLEVDYHGATYQTPSSATHEQVKIATIPFGVHLLDSNGTPIAGARVNLRKADGSYVTYAMTDADGKASFEVVPHSQMKLEVDYHGSTYLTDSLDADTTPLTSVSVYALSLELKDCAGNFIPNARVNLRKAENSYVTYTFTNGEGVASFQVVPGAMMVLEANYNGGTYQTAATVVSADTTLHVQASPITVHLTAQGQPLANTRADLLSGGGTYVTYVTADATGKLSFEVLPGALHKVRVTYGGMTWLSDVVTGESELAKDF